MADIKIVKFKVRRGTNLQRKSVILDQGELGYTTDTKRLFVGNGVLSGGTASGSKIHPILNNFSSLSGTIAEVGDVVVANNLMYQLTAVDFTTVNSWAFIGPKLNSSMFSYDANNTISIKDNGLSASKLLSSNFTNGLIYAGGNINVNYDPSTLTLSSNQLTVKTGGVNELHINSTSFGAGLTGGSNAKIGLNIDPTYFYFGPGNRLSLSSIPATSIPFTALNSAWFGTGLVYDLPNSKINANLGDVDGATIIKDAITKIISLPTNSLSGNSELGMIQSDIYGRVLSNTTSIYDVLTGASLTNSNNTLSSIFNGTPAHTLSGAIPGLEVTIFQAISCVGGVTSTINLTSAGFIVFNGNTHARADGKNVGRFAIPIFAY